MPRNSATITGESVTIHIGSQTYTIKKGDPNYEKAKQAAREEDWDVIPGLVSKGLHLFQWLKEAEGFEYKDNHVWYNGDRLPQDINQRMFDMEKQGGDPRFLARFWRRLQENPSWRSVQQTYRFLKHLGISIDDEGYILAYKGVRTDWYDAHTGKTHLNKVGAVIKEPRNKISDDPRKGCHYGLHAGSLSYASGFSQRTIIVRIDPKDVVCVPDDSSNQKMRVCEYKVVGVHGAKMDLTTDRSQDEAFREEPSAPKPKMESPSPEGGASGMNVETARTAIRKGLLDSDLEKILHDHRKTVREAALTRMRVLEGSKPKMESPSPEAPAPSPAGSDEPWQLGHLSDEELKTQSMENLRKYASRVLKIVGASKLRKFQQDEAGKEIGLVSRIIEARTE